MQPILLNLWKFENGFGKSDLKWNIKFKISNSQENQEKLNVEVGNILKIIKITILQVNK